MVFVVGRTFFRWVDTAMKFLVHPESETAEFASFGSDFSLVSAQARFLHTCTFL